MSNVKSITTDPLHENAVQIDIEYRDGYYHRHAVLNVGPEGLPMFENVLKVLRAKFKPRKTAKG